MKKILCLLLAVLLICGLWGCDKPSSDVPQNGESSIQDEPFPYKLIVLGKDITQGNEKYFKMDADGKCCEIPLLAVLRELGVQIFPAENEIIGVYKGVHHYWKIQDGVFFPDFPYYALIPDDASFCWSRVEEDEIVVDESFLVRFLDHTFEDDYLVYTLYDDLTVEIRDLSAGKTIPEIIKTGYSEY